MIANLVTTRLYSFEDMMKALAPRLIALSEITWKKHKWEDSFQPANDSHSTAPQPDNLAPRKTFHKFKATLGKDLSRLEEMGIIYSISRPAIRLVFVCYRV